MIYVDSNYWIAFFCDAEEKNSRAVEIAGSLSKERVAVAEHCFGEVFTVIFGRYGADKAKAACQKLLGDSRVTIVQASESDWQPAIEIAAKFNVSFADAITARLMENDGIKMLVSFDAGFDRFPKIKRVH